MTDIETLKRYKCDIENCNCMNHGLDESSTGEYLNRAEALSLFTTQQAEIINLKAIAKIAVDAGKSLEAEIERLRKHLKIAMAFLPRNPKSEQFITECKELLTKG